MRTKQEILEYLLLHTCERVVPVEPIIATAQEIEKKYRDELDNNYVGYGLGSDFFSFPDVLEDLDDDDELDIIEIRDGIVVYKMQEKEV